jgi:hypothetical protein
MNMAKSKSKIDFKQILLAKGEYIALGVAGFFLVLLLFSGVSKLTSARDPEKISKDLKTGADLVISRINGSQISDTDAALTVPPNWIIKPIEYKTADVRDFPVTGPQFDPIAKPDTKKENPTVLDFDPNGYQVDLVRIPFKAYDISRDSDGNISIAVIVDKPIGKLDAEALKAFSKNVQRRSGGTMQPPNQNPNPPAPPGPGGVGPGGPGGSGMGPGRPGMPGGRSGSGGQAFNANEKRPAIKYIPIDELDKAIEDGKLPAMTVIPLRGALIHMEIPYKRQVEEIKRALRLPSTDEAKLWGPIYDGYEVQRRVTQVYADGKSDLISDWKDYKFEEQYQEKINSRKVADTFEEGYLSYFIRYDMQLALPLPQLVSELGSYPTIRLPNILNAINKLKEAGAKKIQPSDISERLKNHNLPKDLYRPQPGTDGADIYGGNNVQGFGGGPKQPNKTNPPTSGPGSGPTSYKPGMMMDTGANAPAPVEVESLLLRFIDVDIEPGYTYEYRIRVKMLNPNFGRTSEVSNPADAKVERLFSRWFSIDARNSNITIPSEKYVYATDVAAYRKTIEDSYPGFKEAELRDRLQVKDSQAVVEICRWLPEVKLESGTLREPVGAWVVADIPVGRGEYVGRKTFVKLPLWSSETKSYILREISGNAGTKTGVTNKYHLPKGWLVDFVTPDILVDFQGGRIPTRLGTKNVMEDVESELLIVSPDGKLTVKKSHNDEKDVVRQQILNVWTKWVTEVEKRKADAKADDSGFAPKPGGMP